MNSPGRDGPATIAAWWRTLAPILFAAVGIGVILFDAVIQPPADPITSGFGLVLCGLGPAAALDYLRKGDT